MTSVESMEIHNLHFPQTLWFTLPYKFQWIAYINTLWPSGTTWHHSSWSSMDEERIYIYIYIYMSVMTCCFTASSRCRKQCWVVKMRSGWAYLIIEIVRNMAGGISVVKYNWKLCLLTWSKFGPSLNELNSSHCSDEQLNTPVHSLNTPVVPFTNMV